MTKIIAHRGASYAEPENTLSSINRAWEWGADAVEIDIRVTQDGQLAVIHDASTLRTTGQDYLVAETTLEVLRTLNAGWHKKRLQTPEPIPRLAEVLATIPAGRSIFLELKGADGMLDALENCLRGNSAPPGQITLIGFDFDLMAAAKQRLPVSTVHWLIGKYAWADPREWPGMNGQFIERAVAGGLDGLVLALGHPVMNAGIVDQIHTAGLQAHLGSAPDLARAQHWLNEGADGLMTNLPDWLLHLRNSHEKWGKMAP